MLRTFAIPYNKANLDREGRWVWLLNVCIFSAAKNAKSTLTELTGADAVRIETGIAHKWDRGEEDQMACLYEPLTLPHGEQVRLKRRFSWTARRPPPAAGSPVRAL